MKNRWGNVIEERPKKPEVLVSFNRGDKRAIKMISRWVGLSEQEFEKIIPERKGEDKDG